MSTTSREVRVSPRQLEMLRQIERFENNRCYSATIGEVANKLGISRSTAFEHISALRRKKLISQSRGKARSLRLTALGNRLLDNQTPAEDRKPITANSTAGPPEVMGNLPLVGRVAAGQPIEAFEQQDGLGLEAWFNGQEEIFALEVRGDSMIEEGINDGDYAVCRKCSTAHNGDLVVAILEDHSGTLKRFYRESGRIRLEAANSNYEPIYSSDCRIEAKVVGLIRCY